jgi:Ca-activated chloride channel family protein
MRSRSLTRLLCCAALVVACQSALVQSQSSSIQQPKSNAVYLYATVQNKEGAYALDLDKSYFTLKSQKEIEEITSVSSAAPETSIALLIDVSGSIQEIKQTWQRPALDGLAAFLRQSKGANEYLLMFFAGDTNMAVDWTRDPELVIGAMNRRMSSKQTGATAMYDSCQKAIEQLSLRATERRVIILVTDGEDNASRTESSNFKEMLKKSDVLIYSITGPGMNDSLSAFGRLALNGLAAISGGEALIANRARELTAAFQEIASRLQHQYRIGFYPKTLDNKWHPIDLSVTVHSNDNPPKKKHLVVHTRQGFYAIAR